MKKVYSKLRYPYSISTQPSIAFTSLYHHQNCFAFYNDEVIADFTALEDGSEVVVKEISEVVLRMNGRTNYTLQVHDLSQKFVDLIGNDVSLSNRNLDFRYCYLKYDSEEMLVSWDHPLRKWLWKEEIIEVVTEVKVTVVFKGFITCNLKDTLEAVLLHVAKDEGSYFIYNDRGEILSGSDYLTHLRGSVNLLVKSAMFSTNLDPKNKIDLTKYKTMQDFMTRSQLCEVWYNNRNINMDSQQNTFEFVYRSSYKDCHLHVVAKPNLSQSPKFSICGGSVSYVAKQNPIEIIKNVEQSKIYFHWLAINIYNFHGKLNITEHCN